MNWNVLSIVLLLNNHSHHVIWNDRPHYYPYWSECAWVCARCVHTSLETGTLPEHTVNCIHCFTYRNKFTHTNDSIGLCIDNESFSNVCASVCGWECVYICGHASIKDTGHRFQCIKQKTNGQQPNEHTTKYTSKNKENSNCLHGQCSLQWRGRKLNEIKLAPIKIGIGIILHKFGSVCVRFANLIWGLRLNG